MMNTRTIALGLAAILVFAVSVTAAGGLADNIIVERADTIREAPVSANQTLLGILNGVGARVAVQFANTLRHIALPSPPTGLQTRLGQVAARVAVEYANTVRHSSLVAVPPAFQALLGQVSNRIIFQYANTNRELRLAYPAALVNDRVPPQITAVASSGIRITWTTDEVATSTIEYGTQSGVYPHRVSNPLFTRTHEITLTGLVSGQTYYYRVSSTDRNENTTTGVERSLIGQSTVSLPIVLRR
jgi:hypothetical protein